MQVTEPVAIPRAPVELPLRTRTPDGWAEAALTDTLALLDDHAHLERKAASNAMELMTRWPNPEPPSPNWTVVLSAIARDEADHLHKVCKLLFARGAQMSRGHANPYARSLRNLVRMGQGQEELVDRLMVSAMIELRSCERFEVLGRVCEDPVLLKLYRGLWGSEHNHYRVFLRLATHFEPRKKVMARWDQMLDDEAAILAAQAPGPRMHSGF